MKMKDMMPHGPNPANMTHFNIPSDFVRNMNSARKQLEEAILKYETVIDQLEEVWHTKVSNSVKIIFN